MKQRLFTEILPLYKSKKNNPYVIRIRMRLQESIDSDALRDAVDTTMKRYPYFCVRLQKEGDGFVFIHNQSPVIIGNSPHGTELNAEESNYHMISFSYCNDWIIMDIFHGLTDATGAYEIIRTLLYYYCSCRYKTILPSDGIRTLNDSISLEEWECPVMKAKNLPTPKRHEMSDPLNSIIAANIQKEIPSTVYSIITAESDFMEFTKKNGGSPSVMVSLLLSRAIAKLFPNAKETIRIILCVNQRKALHAPLAHQSLVGGALLEYKESLRLLSLPEQIKAYREMVFEQIEEEKVLEGVSAVVGLTRKLLSQNTDEERKGMATFVDDMASRVGTACVSYVGKANFGEAEKYIQEFHLWSYNSLPITIHISAVNGNFTLDFIQKFHSSLYVNAFLQELGDHGISYDFQDRVLEELPNIKLKGNTD